jgi:hypothetical protein
MDYLKAPIHDSNSISEDELRKLILFNTEIYWWCYYNKETNALYSQYGNLIMDNAFEYLFNLGHIDKDKNFIKEFSN